MEVAGQKLVAFQPWLRLEQPVSVGSVQFVPFQTGRSCEDGVIQGLAAPLEKILSSYVDLANRPVERCTVATISRRQPAWNLFDEDFEEVHEAASLLYLCAMATNEYFQQVRRYVNSTMFDLYLQRFTEPVRYVTITARRRDGELRIAGRKHGNIRFTVPPQADSRDAVPLDTGLVEALNKALTGNGQVMRRLKPALAFLSLATTDSDATRTPAEVILMAAAFEQLLNAHKARDLSQKLGDLFQSFGSVTVGNVLTARPGIAVDRRYATAQGTWFAHRKWIEEFYQLRNAYVHGESLSARTWGWTPFEHLVMAAFVFPLTVKLILLQQGCYILSRTGRVHCGALDLLLGSTQWGGESAGSGATVWEEKLRESRSKIRVADALSVLGERGSGQQ